MAAKPGVIISGVFLIAGVLTMLFGSFVVGLITTLVGFVAMAVFAVVGGTGRRETC
jgi:hypothetical protein